MNYEQCFAYLEWIQKLGIRFGLDNVRTVLNSLGNPHHSFPSILVAGSNGKGSVCAMISNVLRIHGFKTGLYTSPHLEEIRERFQINGELISVDNFCGSLTKVKINIDKLIVSGELESPLTYFELLTCLAFLYFKEEKVEMAVLEVGMGGRFDATNVVTPVVSVITTISREHQKFLGRDIKQIALEKAGIIKYGVPVICGAKKKEARDVIKRKAEELKAPFYDVFDRNVCLKEKKKGKSFSFIYKSFSEKYYFTPSLLGKHQGENACVAICLSEQLGKRWKSLEKKKVIQGIETTSWEGRLEFVSENPLILIDGAHNEEGAKALKEYIEDFGLSGVILLFAIMKDKNIQEIADILFPGAEKIVLTKFQYYKTATPEYIKSKALKYKKKMILEPDVKKAVKIAIQKAGEQRCVVVAGSLFLAGEVKRYFQKKIDH
ncbi:MAG: bifunctional folylpolyglutamate synthase/dihydrofolate synthase [Candidatus Aminicenantaceae bacterium]